MLACGFAPTTDIQINDAHAYNMYTRIHNIHTHTRTLRNPLAAPFVQAPGQHETPGQVLWLDGGWNSVPALKQLCL